MPEIICLGEALIDMVAYDVGPLAQASGFQKAPGGAPANVAACIGILGGDVGFIGKIGDDPWGQCLQETLSDCGVDVSPMVKTKEEFTRLAFVSFQEGGGHDFLFHGVRGADELLDPDDLSKRYIQACDILHFGSITTIKEPARLATYEAVKLARDAACLISYDPNMRPPLWPNEQEALDQMTLAMELVDVVKVNDDELKFLAGQTDVARGAQVLHDLGPELVTITMGGEGCYFHHTNGSGYVEGHEVDVVDTVGCGDSFVGSLLVMINESETDLADMNVSDLERICSFANAAAAVTATGKGAIPALPARVEVLEMMGETGEEDDDPGF